MVGARKTADVVLLFFLAGSLTHLALARLYARHAYQAGSNRSFVDHPLTIIGVSVLGGLSVAWFMFRLLQETIRYQEVPASRVILRGGFYGIFATTAALELFYILLSGFLTARSSATYSSIWTFVSFLMDVQTYGMQPLILGAPVAFLYGAIGGATIRWLVPRNRSFHKPTEKRKVTGNLALGLGIIGCLFFWVPILGVLLDVLALIYGTRVLRQMPKPTSRDQIKAITGMVLGSAALVYLTIGFVILFWPRK